jgi:hypothetical protein
MMMQEIEKFLLKEPFEAFRINTSGGLSYIVDKPHNVAMGKSKISLFPAGTDDWILIAALHIASIESIKQAA